MGTHTRGVVTVVHLERHQRALDHLRAAFHQRPLTAHRPVSALCGAPGPVPRAPAPWRPAPGPPQTPTCPPQELCGGLASQQVQHQCQARLGAAEQHQGSMTVVVSLQQLRKQAAWQAEAPDKQKKKPGNT